MRSRRRRLDAANDVFKLAKDTAVAALKAAQDAVPVQQTLISDTTKARADAVSAAASTRHHGARGDASRREPTTGLPAVSVLATRIRNPHAA